MNIKVSIEVPQKLPIKQLDSYIDNTVHNIARITMDRTQPHVPYRTGHMLRDIMARGVKGSNKTYTLGYNSAKYTPYVWAMPQGTNWTNPRSYAQWFMTEFKNHKEIITLQAVNQAKAVMK